LYKRYKAIINGKQINISKTHNVIAEIQYPPTSSLVIEQKSSVPGKGEKV
jgi:hypothetical protein